MRYNPIKCWVVQSIVVDPEIEKIRPADFSILKKSILKRGYRGFLIDERSTIEEKDWYHDFMLGFEAMVYIDGSGLYKIVNLDLSENEVYFERLNLPVGYRPWIFYSWQSDLPDVREEIESVLLKVIEDINKTRNPRQLLELKNSAEIVGGAHNIVTKLKKEIDQSLIIVADLTNVSQVFLQSGNTKEKWHPNSNVIFEMSYALTKKPDDQVLLVKKNRPERSENTTPFDLYQNLTHFYENSEDLEQRLKGALMDSLEKIGYIAPLPE